MINKWILFGLTILVIGCGENESSETEEGSTEFNKEAVPVRELNIDEVTDIDLYKGQTFSLTEDDPDKQFGAVCQMERYRLNSQQYLDSLEVIEEKCGEELTTGVRYQFGDGQRYLVEKVTDTRSRVTHCLADGSLYYFVDVERTGEGQGKFSMSAGEIVLEYSNNFAGDGVIMAKEQSRSEQEDGQISAREYFAKIDPNGISTLTNSDWGYYKGPADEWGESDSRQVMKLTTEKGMYYAHNIDPFNEPPNDEFINTYYFNGSSYRVIEGEGDSDFAEDGSLFVGESLLPTVAKDVDPVAPEGAWNCIGVDVEISSCQQNGSVTPTESDPFDHPCAIN